jgi:hypothetical protein
MKATIEQTLEVAARELGRPFKRYDPDRYMTHCIGHEDGKGRGMSVNRIDNVVHCFGPCMRADNGKSGAGVLQVPLLFGLARTQADAIRWLVKHQLIDEIAPARSERPPVQRHRYPTDPKHLLEPARLFRRSVYADLASWFDFRTVRRIQGLLDVANSRYVEEALPERLLAVYTLLAHEIDDNIETLPEYERDLVLRAAHARVHRSAPSLFRHLQDPTCSCYGWPDAS